MWRVCRGLYAPEVWSRTVLGGTVLPAYFCYTQVATGLLSIPDTVPPSMWTCPDWITPHPAWCVCIQSPQQMHFIRGGRTDRSRWWAGKGLCHVSRSLWGPNMSHPPAACLTDPQALAFLFVNICWDAHAAPWTPSPSSNRFCPLSYKWRQSLAN